MVEKRRRGKASQGSTQATLAYLQPEEEKREGGGWTEGWIGMPVEAKKKIFYSCRTAVVA